MPIWSYAMRLALSDWVPWWCYFKVLLCLICDGLTRLEQKTKMFLSRPTILLQVRNKNMIDQPIQRRRNHGVESQLFRWELWRSLGKHSCTLIGFHFMSLLRVLILIDLSRSWKSLQILCYHTSVARCPLAPLSWCSMPFGFTQNPVHRSEIFLKLLCIPNLSLPPKIMC